MIQKAEDVKIPACGKISAFASTVEYSAKVKYYAKEGVFSSHTSAQGKMVHTNFGSTPEVLLQSKDQHAYLIPCGLYRSCIETDVYRLIQSLISRASYTASYPNKRWTICSRIGDTSKRKKKLS